VTTARPVHLALVGPTAAGKSAVALEVARATGDAEIVSLDSMQVYRHLDIGTAKPSAAERAEIAHHLVDVADPAEEWSVVRTQTAAQAAIAGIEARGRRAILVGGTGLYVRAVVDGLAVPGEDLRVRAALEQRVSRPGGLEAAYAVLREVDPDAAARIHPANARRVVRALEVITATGRRFSSFGPGVHAAAAPALPVVLVGLWLPRQVLAARIAARVDAMRTAGLLDEVAALLDRPLSRTAAQAIGYREVLAHLRGEIATLDDALDAAVRRTRAFARRQRMWFRRDRRITWVGGANSLGGAASAVRRCWEQGRRPALVP
jgi:tRNA dimethylallyltransferase